MSYPGSHQQFGLSDLQLLQQQLMLARLQELQRQQQLGQFGDGKHSNPVNNLSMLAKHAVGGQFPNLGGTPYNASGVGASSNLNWMHQNVSSSMQGVTRDSSYPHGEGLLMNPSLQQPDMSLYGTPLTSGRGNLGQCTPMQGVSYNSNEKPMPQMPQLTNSLFGDKHYVSQSHAHSIDGPFMLRQDLQGQGSMGHVSGHMLNNGLSSQNFLQEKSFQKVTSPQGYNKIGEPPVDTVFLGELTKQTNDLRGTTTLDPLEEKILFDTEDSSWDISFSKLAALDTTEFVEASSGKENISSFPCIQSGSWSALMQSAVAEASSSDTGIQEEVSGLSFQNIESSVGRQPSNVVFNEKQSSSDHLRAPVSSVDSMKSQHSSLWPDCQQFPRVPDPAGLLTDNCAGVNDRDICQGSRTSALSMSGMIKNDYEFNQQAVDCHSFMPMNQDIVQKDYKSTSYGHQSNKNPMAIDTLYKKAAEIYGNRNHYQGENSCDSYNSKVSQAGHGFLNAEDSESSARSRQKSQNPAICISSPGTNSQQECFDHLKSTTFPTNTNPMVKGKPNMLADTFSKGSPASDVSASFDSQYTSELDKESQPRGLGNTLQAFSVSQTESQVLNVSNISVSQGAATPDKFSFQSSVPGDSRLVSLGRGQKGQTWWTPSSFGQSYTPLQGASLPETCAGNSNVYGKTASEALNLKSEGNSLEAYISDLQHVNNQVEGKNISTFESVRKTFPETSQSISLPGFSPTQDAYHLKKANSSDRESTRSEVLSVAPSENFKDLPSSFGLPSRSLTMGQDIYDEQNASMMENVAVVEDRKSAEIYRKISADDLAYAGSSINSELAPRSFSGATLRGLPTSSQPSTKGYLYPKPTQVGLTALSDLNKQWVPDIPRQQPVPEIHSLPKNPFGNQIGPCSSGDNSNMVEASTQFSALQYMHSHKVPMLQSYSNGSNVLYDRMRQFQMRAQFGPVGYVQNEYIKNRPMFSLRDSSAVASIKPYENDQLSRIATYVDGADASKKYELLSGLANQIVASKQSLPPSVPLSDDNVHLVISRSKKRKSMYDCLPWYKNVMETRQELPDISAAEEEWAEVTNRLKEHVDEGERNEMGPIFRAKRRLIATTELTQLVFQPPPPSVLSVDARIEYEIVVYSISKLALADACGLANVTRTDCSMPHYNRNGGMANSLSDKATELLKRTKELETYIERSRKGISVLDILIECQELEKFGIINHFAKFHYRGPESVGNLSASSSTGMTSVRPLLQRYVNAVPVPSKLPEGAHCISL